MTDRELMQMVLRVFDWLESRTIYQDGEIKETHKALRDRLAQPKQNDEKGRPMTYWGGLASDQPAQSKPEPRKLSHTEIGQLWSEHQEVYAFAKAIESKLTGRAS